MCKKMNNEKPNILLGCVLAPLAAPLMMLLITLFAGNDLRGSSYDYGSNDIQEIIGIAGMYLVIGAPLAYAITIVFGLPFYLIIKKRSYINFWSITLGSAFVAIFPLLLISAKNGFTLYDDSEKNSLLLYLAFALCGYAVGLTFWYVSGLYKQITHNPTLQGTC